MLRAGIASLVLIGLCASPLRAQVQSTNLVGVVSDPQGAVLPGVTVTATSPALIGSRTAVTEVNGTYRIPSLPEGTYALAFELSGFQTYKTREHRLVARADPHR